MTSAIAKLLEEQLDELLSESIESARQRAETTFDAQVDGADSPIVLFGCGRLGRRVLQAMRSDSHRPVCFADEDPALWGSCVDGLPVLSPDEACRRFGGRVAFVVTIWREDHSFVRTERRLTDRFPGSRVISAFCVLWKYDLPYFIADRPDRLLPQAHEVRRAFGLFEDHRSLAEYLAHVRFRLHLDFGALLEPLWEHQFCEDFLPLSASEVFVDCGAYDGDSIRAFLERTGSAFEHIIAIEPDPANFDSLERFVAGLPEAARDRISLLPLAVGDRRKTVRLDAQGTEASMLGEDAGIPVSCDSLDHILQETTPTLVKMDIEGAEPDALRGAGRTISDAGPILIVSAYHAQDHLWRIPLFIHDIRPDYKFYLRTHMNDGFELRCYAIAAHTGG